MILNYVLSADEYLESQYAYRMRMAKGCVLFRNLYALSLVLILLGANAHLSGSALAAGLLYIVGAALLLERAILWRLRDARTYRDVRTIQQPIQLRIDQNNLLRTSSNGTEEIRWASILACHEGHKVFVLQFGPENLLTIPKRAFPPGELNHFRELRQKELIVKTTRQNVDAPLLRFAAGWAVLAFLFIVLSVGYIYNFLTQLTDARRAPTGAVSLKSPASANFKKASPEELRGRGTVYFITLGKMDPASVRPLIDVFHQRYGLEIHLLPQIDLPSWEFNASRKQFAAEDLVAAMELSYPKLAADPTAILIGITDQDMYIQELNWSYAFSFREEERYAVVSTARLSEDEDGNRSLTAADLQKRTLKVMIRDVGILYYRLQPSADYRSILYREVDEPTDLDGIGDDYLDSDAAVGADLHVENGDPCFMLRNYSAQERQRPLIGTLDSCSGSYREQNLETVQVDLRYGLLLDQRTDFLTSDRMPLELTRVLRTQDSRSRAFGIGGNHNLNIFLVGDTWPFTWIDLVLEHGGRSHFRRANWGFGYWDARYTNRDAPGSEFSGSTIQWEWPGWKLKNKGMTYHFPDSYRAARPEQGALTSIEDYSGKRLTLDRDSVGNLLLARSPDGHDLNFKYDAEGRIIEINQRAGGQFSYSYDSGHLSRVTDDHQRITEYSYDSSGQLNRIQQDGRLVCSIDYDSAGRVQSERLANGRTYLFDYQLSREGATEAVKISDSAGPVRTVRFFGSDYVLDTGVSAAK